MDDVSEGHWLIEFARVGSIGNLRLGIGEAEVVAAIGRPECSQSWGNTAAGKSNVTLKYGDFEIGLLDGLLFSMQINFDEGGTKLFGDYLCHLHLSLDDLIEERMFRQFSTFKVEFSIDERFTFDEQKVFRAKCGTRFGFADGRLLTAWIRSDDL